MSKDKPEKRGRGRPKVHDEPRKHLGIRPSMRTQAALEAYCESQTVKPTQSQVLLRALELFLENEGYLKE